MGFTVIHPDDLDWQMRPSDSGVAERHVAGLSELAGYEHSRANFWRYEPGASGRRHKDMLQEETFVIVRGTSVKARHLRRDSRCTVLAVTEDWRGWVSVEGEAQLFEALAAFERRLWP